MILSFLTGLALYSFVEYAAHRWLLHGPMIKTHAIHHQDPKKHVMTPVSVLLVASAVLWLCLGFWVMTGALAGWLVSSLIHWRLHVGNLTADWVLRLRAHHDDHHRQVNTNYGVTTTLWDKLFKTKKKGK